jgi:non-specific serine/threonine protein kinase
MAEGLNIHRVDNLPAPISMFIGRERELTSIKLLILANRLVTLTGAGGSGKTRLALEVTKSLIEEFKHGVWFIELASLTDATLIPQKLASTVNIREQQSQSYLDALLAFFSTRQFLLIIDNCEHLVAGCAQVTDFLLQKCPDLRILTTSREVLGITGEAVYPVPPLTLPDLQPWRNPASAEVALKQYERSESVRLFIARAKTNSPEFKLTVHNGAWVAEICRRLDGMPLAIELAAARVRALSVQEIAERLDDRFSLLTGGSRTAHPRHQTLAATIDWSYASLSEREQRLLQMFSVFSGGGRQEAIEAVCAGGDIEKGKVFDLLSQLVDKSLVVAEQRSEETRYKLLETIREFALDKLAETGGLKSTKDRHFEFFLQLAENAQLKLFGSNNMILSRKLEEEHDNLRAALDWALDNQYVDAGLRLASALSFFWSVRGYLKESIRWLERALEMKHDASPASTAMALRSFSLLLITSKDKDFDRIERLLNESLTLYQGLEDKEGIARVYNYLGWNQMEQGNFPKAREFLNQSLKLRREIGNPMGIANTLQNFAPISLVEGDIASAKAYTEETIALFQQAGDRHGVARTTMDYADIARMEGDTMQALKILTRVLSQLTGFGDKWTIIDLLRTISLLEIEQNNLKQAAILYGAIDTMQNEINMTFAMNYDNEVYEKNRTIVQETLSGTEFDQLFEKGRGMTLEQVVEFVSHPLDDPTPNQTKKEKFGGLTGREHETALLIAEGKSNREVAEAMTVSVKTVESYVTRIMRKLGLDSRVQIANWVRDKDLD